jgi:hypothetical protein
MEFGLIAAEKTTRGCRRNSGTKWAKQWNVFNKEVIGGECPPSQLVDSHSSKWEYLGGVQGRNLAYS